VSVLDASLALDVLLRTEIGLRATSLVLNPAERLTAPDHLDVEVSRVLRRRTLAGGLTVRRATEALDDLFDLPVVRYPSAALVRRAFALRDNLTLDDALYVALAEGTGEPLLTSDRRLGRAVEGHTEVGARVFG
jgi:predicted nucleic acid-binding protein